MTKILVHVVIFSGGFWHSELVTKNLITAYVPFLPLERSHVKQCIQEDLAGRSVREVPEDKVQLVVDELTFGPEGIHAFSTSGCKRVPEKIDYVFDDHY